MQKFLGLLPTKIGHVDRVVMATAMMLKAHVIQIKQLDFMQTPKQTAVLPTKITAVLHYYENLPEFL